jgi:glycosyltransferase involved in cell wall biosynthesis
LGHQNRDIANHLGVERWLVPRFVRHRDPTPHGLPCQIDTMSTGLEPVELAAWLDGLDAVVFVESPVFPQLTSLARRLGVSVVCIPNWEWLHAGLDWLDDVDLMLCPTHYTAGLLSEWKARFGFGWIIDTVPWPIDTERFHFVPRRVCQTFVFVNGSGGAAAVADDRSKAMFQRKGLDVLLAAARKVPQIPLIIYASSDDIESEPPNVQWRPPPADNTQLYHDGDVYIQPSRWEGLGLPLLECQAAGMPLITTNLPPMNEHRPLALIPAMDEAVFLSPEFCIPAAHIEPEDLAEVMRSVHGQEINAVSIRARQFVERDHSWHVAKPRILNRISQLVCDGPQVNS